VTTRAQRRERGKVYEVAMRETPKPQVLAWCVRAWLWQLYGHRPWYEVRTPYLLGFTIAEEDRRHVG
jgi:hypothetical protein